MLDLNDLPKGFAPAKPIADYAPADLTKLEASGNMILQRKRDGMRHFLVVTPDGRPQIYSRRMDDATASFPSVCQLMVSTLPPGTVLDAEYIVDDAGADQFKLVASVCRSLPAKASLRHRTIGGAFMVFDVLFLGGLPTHKAPYKARLDAIGVIAKGWNSRELVPVEQLKLSLAEAQRAVRTHGWEGLVAWDGAASTVIKTNGHPQRVNCYKWKPILEDDFVVTGYELGENSFSQIVGALYLCQYAKGTLVECGKVGTGLDVKTRKEALGWTYPCVAQVAFSERQDSGALRFPVFVRLRTDKAPQECKVQQ